MKTKFDYKVLLLLRTTIDAKTKEIRLKMQTTFFA